MKGDVEVTTFMLLLSILNQVSLLSIIKIRKYIDSMVDDYAITVSL